MNLYYYHSPALNLDYNFWNIDSHCFHDNSYLVVQQVTKSLFVKNHLACQPIAQSSIQQSLHSWQCNSLSFSYWVQIFADLLKLNSLTLNKVYQGVFTYSMIRCMYDPDTSGIRLLASTPNDFYPLTIFFCFLVYY